MDVQGKPGTLVHAIAESDIFNIVGDQIDQLRCDVIRVIAEFTSESPSPGNTLRFENRLGVAIREFARRILDSVFSRLEPEIDQMPGTIKYRNRTFRRLSGKTTRRDIVTRFGKIELTRGRYRWRRAGKTIFPLEVLLGIENGFTPAAADMIGKQFAATGSSQGRTLDVIGERFGASIGTEKLRKLVATLAGSLEPFREEAQVNKLIELIQTARNNGKQPVLSVSRDGVSLGLAPWSFFEMASVGCISVLVNGKRLGTVYLGHTPETNQETLSNELTSLLKATIHRCGTEVPDIVYVTDAGKIETSYWRNVLRKFFVAGRRIKVTRVVDYYHAAERLTTIADALKFGKDRQKRSDWLEHVRGLLLEPGGHGRVLRSIAKMRVLYGYKSSLAETAEAAEKYLRRYRRYMNYADLKVNHFPIGSGVVESACKQIVSERMKLSGMRWKREGGQQTMTLRCLLLSGIWDVVYKTWLASKPTVSDLINLEPQ